MDKDPLLEQVRLFINDSNNKAISAKDIARKFSMGVKRATRILEQFNGEGIAPSVGGEVKSKPNTPTNQWGKITSQAAGASFEETEEFLKNFPDHEPAKTHLAILKEQDEVNRVANERNEKNAKARGFSSAAALTKTEINARKLERERETKAQQIGEEKQRKLERKWAATERREANKSQKNTSIGKAATPKPTSPAPKPKKSKPAAGSSTPKTWNQLLKAHGGNAADIPQDVLEAHAKVYPRQNGPKTELTSRQNSVQPRATGPIPVSPAPTSGGGSGGKPPITPPQSSPLPEEPSNPKGNSRSSEKLSSSLNDDDNSFNRHFQGMEPKPGETAGLNRPIPTRFANQRGNLTLPNSLKGIGNLDIDQFANSRTLFQNDVAVNTRGPKYSNVMQQKIDKEKFNATKEEFAERKKNLVIDSRLRNTPTATGRLLAPDSQFSLIEKPLSSVNMGNPVARQRSAERVSTISSTLSSIDSDLDLELYKQYFDPEGIDNAKSGILSPMSNEIATSRHGAISAAAKGLSAFGATFVPGSGYATRETLEHGFGMGFKNAVAASRGEHLARFLSNANPLGASGRAAFTESLGIANRSDVQRFLQNRTFMNGVGAFGAPIGAAAIVGIGMHDMQDPGEILGNLATGGAVIGGFRAGKSAGAMLTPANSKIGRGLGMAVGGTVGAVTGGLVAAGLYGILNDASQNDSAIRKFAKKVGTKEMYSMSQDTRESLTARQQALNKLAKSGLNDRAQLLRK